MIGRQIWRRPVTTQEIILTMIVVAFGAFAVTLGGVSTMLWVSPPKK